MARAAAHPTETADVQWEGRPLLELVEHVIRRYHLHEERLLERASYLAGVLRDVHLTDRLEPYEALTATLVALSEEFERHTAEEEQSVFPLICAGDGLGSEQTVWKMQVDHRAHRRLLDDLDRQIRVLTAGNGHEELLQDLRGVIRELDADIREHLDFEDLVLYPRVLDLD